MSVHSNISSNTTFSTVSGIGRAKGASVLFRKKDTKPLFGSWSDTLSASPSGNPSQTLGSADNLSASPTTSMPRLSTSTSTAASSDLHVEGLLIRKHVKEGEEKARNRRWHKIWCLLTSDEEKGVEMVCWKVESLESVPAPSTEPTQKGIEDGVLGLEKSTLSTGLSRGSEESKRGVRFAATPPEMFNLLHSHAAVLPPPGYSDQRPHVFSLRLSNNHTYYFHTPSGETAQAWVRCITYWAARRSKEPLKGGVGSMEYGWGVVLRDLKDREESSEPSTPLTDNQKKERDREAKKIKVVEWTPPGGLGMVVSNLSEEQQLHSMRRQLEWTEREV
ncbi:hypothetical protein HK097_006288, partial [Rhizophlyctis rosea]